MEIHARLVELHLLNHSRGCWVLVEGLSLAVLVLCHDLSLELWLDLFLLELLFGFVVLVGLVGVKLQFVSYGKRHKLVSVLVAMFAVSASKSQLVSLCNLPSLLWIGRTRPA